MDQQWQYENRESVIISPVKPLQTVVETESSLNGGLRDECRVFYCGANAYIRSAEILGSKIDTEGRIHFRVLYAQGDLSKVLSLEVDAEFSQYIPVAAEQEECIRTVPNIECSVIHTKAHVQNGRIQLRAILQLSGHVRSVYNIGCAKSCSDNSNIQCMQETLTSQKIVGEGEIQSTLKDELELADLLQVKETLLADAHAIVEDVKSVSSNTVCVTGSVLIDAYHTSEMPQRPLIVSHHKIPYEQEISFSGKSSSVISARTCVRDIAVVSSDGDADEKWMRCEIQLYTHVKAVEDETVDVIEDAYPVTGRSFDTMTRKLCLTQKILQEELAESGRLTVNLPANAPGIRQPLLAFLNPVPVRQRRSGARLMIDGTMQITVIYIADESKVPVSADLELPFAAAFSTEATEDDRIALKISEATVQSITSDRVEVKYILHMLAEGEKTHEVTVLTDVLPVENEESLRHGGISLRYVQPQETLWDIGKQFHIATDTIMIENQMKNSQVTSGDALIISCSSHTND